MKIFTLQCPSKTTGSHYQSGLKDNMIPLKSIKKNFICKNPAFIIFTFMPRRQFTHGFQYYFQCLNFLSNEIYVISCEVCRHYLNRLFRLHAFKQMKG